MIYRVELSERARDDLERISDWVEEQAGRRIAENYDRRIRERIATLAQFPNRGTPDDQIAPGVRTLSFERRLRIAYIIVGDTVQVYRVFHSARDIGNL